MSTPPPQQPRRSSSDSKKVTPPASSVVTRNGARKAKIQTRAMSAGAKPSASVIAAKRKALQKKKNNFDTVLRDHYQMAMDSKTKVKGATGLVTEPRMAEHRCLWDDNYPECPARLTSVIERCHELDLINQCVQYPPRAATKEELCTLHSPSVYDMMEKTHLNNDLDYLEEVSSKYDAVYIHPSTHELALLAAGSTIDLVDRVVSDEVQNGAALVRPPGHHAMKSEPCGYCFYNNVALAARHAIDKRGLNRILIVDWDVHHGQATQQMFYNDPRVVYFSIHRYEHGAFWPNLRQSNFNYIGTGQGKGYNFNVPLNKTGMKDADYLAIWHQLLLPMALEYQPELIIISAGYDAATGCPEFSPQLVIVSAGYDAALGDEKGEMELTPACYAHLLNMLMSVCPRVCVVLEGGYCLQSLAEGAAITLRTLLGHAPPKLEDVTEPSDEIREAILNCIYVQKPFWNCYTFQHTYSISGPPNVCDEHKIKHTVAVKWEGDETRLEKFLTRDCYPLQDDEKKKQIAERLNHLRLVTDLSLPKHAVGYIYDQAMLKHKNICEPGHVECPERIMRIHERHREYALLARVHELRARRATDHELLAVHTRAHLDSGHVECPERIMRIHERHREYALLARVHELRARRATDHELLAVHTRAHLDRLKELASTKLRHLHSQKDEYDSVYFHPDSLESATTATGCVLQMVDAVLSGAVRSGVCVVRPPGHHADAAVPSGFCLLNNAAAAAAHACRAHALARVLVLDWDVHHGNGTQRITYDDNKILYMSIHRYDNGSFFPHSKDADYTAVGTGKGEGFNVNIPWNKRGMGDAEYMAAFTQVILPIAYEYNPDLVIVSAGFDACVGDPLGGCKVSPECYGRMTQLLKGLAGGRVILCLEGGYNITSISYAMTMCTKALLGDPILHHYDPKIVCHWSAIDSIHDVIRTHSKYWKCLKFQLALPSENVLEPPAPSRGLTLEYGIALAEISLTSTLDESTKSIDSKSTSQLETSLEASMANLSIEKKCTDGIHCGTDDEEEKPDSSKRKKESSSSGNECSKKVNAEGGSSSQKATLVDYLADNLQAIVDGEMFAVIPLQWCPHLESLYAIPSDVKFEQGVKCIDCDHTEENWVCLHCFVTACSRSINGHMQAHHAATGHALVLSLTDLSVWCNVCDAYVDNALLYDAKNNAHKHKFGEEMPWCYKTDIQMQ